MNYMDLVKRLYRHKDNIVPKHRYVNHLLWDLRLPNLNVAIKDDIRAYWFYQYMKNTQPCGSAILFVASHPVAHLQIKPSGNVYLDWFGHDQYVLTRSSVLNMVENNDPIRYTQPESILKEHYNVPSVEGLQGVDLSTITIHGVKPYLVSMTEVAGKLSEYGLKVQMTEDSKPMNVSLTICDIPLQIAPPD